MRWGVFILLVLLALPLVSAGATGMITLNIAKTTISTDNVVNVEATVPQLEVKNQEPGRMPVVTGAVVGVGDGTTTLWIYIMAVLFLLLMVLFFYQLRKSKRT